MLNRLFGGDTCFRMHNHNAPYLFDFKRNPSRNDHIRSDEHDLRSLQENHTGNVYSCSPLYPQIHIHLISIGNQHP